MKKMMRGLRGTLLICIFFSGYISYIKGDAEGEGDNDDYDDDDDASDGDVCIH
jgi:hypothetical protein